MLTNENAFNLAAFLEEASIGDGVSLGPTDAALAAKALRIYGRRTIRRNRMALAVGLATVLVALSTFGLLPSIGPAAAFALDLNGDGVVNAMDVQMIVDRFMPVCPDSPAFLVATVSRIIETDDGIYAATLAQTRDPSTHYRLLGWRRIGPAKARPWTLKNEVYEAADTP